MNDSTEPAAPGDDTVGAGVVLASFVGTSVLVVAAAGGALAPDALGVAVAAVSIALFAAGVAGLLYGYGTGVVRSRDEAISLGGLFFLSGDSAPRVVAFRLRLALAVQTVAAVAAASIRPYTAVAFVVLGPMFGLGQLAVWGARHGRFAPRTDDPRRLRRRGSGDGGEVGENEPKGPPTRSDPRDGDSAPTDGSDGS